jgi:capsular polysaccharide biosynthesis protein
MEIRDYLRAIRRILPLLIILPIVAGAITGYFLEKQPSKYQANATVVVPAISGNGTSQSAASQYVSTFKDVLVSTPVVTDVSQKFNIPVSELVAGLSANTLTASSNIIHVTLVGSHGKNLTGAVREATVEAMDAIAQPALVQAQNEVSNSQTLLTKANTDEENFIAVNGNPSPLAKYNGDYQRLNNLKAELTLALINGDKGKVPALNSSITQQGQLVQQDGVQLQQWTGLSNATAAALAAHNHAVQTLVTAQALVATDQNPSTVTVVNVGRLSKLADVIKFAAIAFALALLMLLGLVLILELMRSGRRTAAVAGPAQGSLAGAAAVPASAQAEPSAQAVPTTPEAPAPVSAPRDPWRATPPPAALGTVTNGNGNGNGNGHAKGNGHAAVPEVEADPERSDTGLGVGGRR